MKNYYTKMLLYLVLTFGSSIASGDIKVLKCKYGNDDQDVVIRITIEDKISLIYFETIVDNEVVLTETVNNRAAPMSLDELSSLTSKAVLKASGIPASEVSSGLNVPVDNLNPSTSMFKFYFSNVGKLLIGANVTSGVGFELCYPGRVTI